MAAFPVVAGPILFFVAIEQGQSFAAHAATAAILAVAGNIGFGIAYSWVSRTRSWFLSLSAGWAAYLGVIVPSILLEVSSLQAAVLTMVFLSLASRLYPQALPNVPSSGKPRSDVAYRMLAGLVLVLAVTVFSGSLGPRLAGLLAVFPVMGSVLAVFSHRNVSQPFAVGLLKGMVQGFFAFTMFCWVLATLLESQSIAVSFMMALAAAVVVQAVLMRRQPRPNSKGG
ncbi:hypothetical protein [Paucimonas lemoignei]|uniref:hypothetical protein n=1 Tax=Paucimonas lemoignei TaxID=29443 RepID=UPI0014046B12|nr:hypothetical protein [Paucimonas lemoignei]